VSDTNVIARAFELARSGQYRTLSEVQKALKREGFFSVEEHLRGGSIRKQLKEMFVASASTSRSGEAAKAPGSPLGPSFRP
jgi:hypothetical protein